ncbi:hypothetical protein BKA58DRAFT_465511 [Alternaria rosae]|uniref:uncharacterized protein n=1 Tax=Alternaria rosae TaxID=1187941 RepID=UPI001E8EC104|nr:uncharacterized protein BKA58DRAFT_465511 [Alternaria rosae]KAH6877751.1 hypothetical protein BKA58DRAFT_465511 [Alternaria rosae]
MAPDQHVELAYEAQDNTQYDTMDDLQIEAQLRSQVNQGCSEVTPDTYSDHYMISPVTEEEPRFQAPVQRIRQTSTAPPIGKRQESFMPGSIAVSIPSSYSSVAEGLLVSSVSSRTASFSPTLGTRRTGTMSPSQLPQGPSNPLSVADNASEQPILLRLASRQSTLASRRTSTATARIQRQDSFRPTSPPSADDLKAQSVTSRATFRQPTLETSRTSIAKANNKRQDSIRPSSPSALYDLEAQALISRASTQQGTLGMRRISTATGNDQRQYFARPTSPLAMDNLEEQPVFSRVASRQDPPREADDTSLGPSVDAEVTQRSFERQKIIQRETMPNERLTIADRTLSSSLPLRTRTGSLIHRSPKQDVEEPLDEYTELESQELAASTHTLGREEDADQVGRSPTTNFEADPEPFALHMYQRTAEEPSEEELEPESQSATSIGANSLEEAAGQFERALTTHVLSNPDSFALRVYQRIADEPLGEEPEPNAIAPTNYNDIEEISSQIERAPTTQVSLVMEPLEHGAARSPAGTTAPVERRVTQTSPGHSANIPWVVTITRDVERKQNSAAPDQLDRVLTMQLSPELEPLVYTDPQGLLSKTAHLEKVKTQAPSEFSVNVSRVSTVALELNRRRSSAAPGFTPSARGSEPPVHSSDKAVLDETPQMKRTLKVAPTEPRTADRRRSSAAPAVTAPPPKTIGEGI